MNSANIMSFREFSSKFLALNKDATKSEIKQQYLVEKNQIKKAQQKVTIIAVPSIEQPVPKELEEEHTDLTDTVSTQADNQESAEELLEINKQRMITTILLKLDADLHRIINGVTTPRYPRYPITRELLNPLDIYRIQSKLRVDEESSDIQIPMLVILMADPSRLLSAYEASKRNNGEEISILSNLFKSNGFVFSDSKWVDKSPPRLRDEFIEHQIEKMSSKYPKEISFNKLFEEFSEKNEFPSHILDEVYTTKDLLRIIAINPEIISGNENLIPLFGLNMEELNNMLAEPDISVRKKMVLKMIQLPSTEQAVSTEQAASTEQAVSTEQAASTEQLPSKSRSIFRLLI